MPKFVEMDRTVTLADQLKDEGGNAAIMKRQPGFISTQLHRGVAGSGAFLNFAVWESVAHFRAAFANPEFRARLAEYPESATASPHLFRPVAVPGICVA
jgi:heme-degrading monooxygenase HmoA